MSLDLLRTIRRRYCPPGTPPDVWPPLTDEQCVKIVNEYCYKMNKAGGEQLYGLLYNPNHTNWGGYSLDVLAMIGGTQVDILEAAPANVRNPNWSAVPTWIVLEHTTAPPQAWHPPKVEWLPEPQPDPDPEPEPEPDPEPEPEPEPCPCAADLRAIGTLIEGLTIEIYQLRTEVVELSEHVKKGVKVKWW